MAQGLRAFSRNGFDRVMIGELLECSRKVESAAPLRPLHGLDSKG